MAMNDDEFDALMGAARDDAPGPDLMARVLADAQAVQETPAVVTTPAPKGSWLSDIFGAVGGWGAASGIAAAGVMGLAIGLYAPSEVELWLGADALSFGEASYGVTPDLSGLWTEDGDV